MRAPPIVWIDERIAAGLPQDKDGELAERGVNQIRYVTQDRVNALVNAAHGPAEFFVQILVAGVGEAPDNSGNYPLLLVGLTNFGRVMRQIQIDDGDAEAGQRVIWENVEPPELEA